MSEAKATTDHDEIRRWVEAHPSAADYPIHELAPTPTGGTPRITLAPGRYRVRLITDPGFKVRGHFVRTTRGDDGKPHTTRLTATVLFEGVGGALVVRPPLSEQAVKEAGQAGLQPGDVEVAEERDWPTDLVGLTLGTIARIDPKRDAPSFAEVRVEPPTNLEMLDEVMVLVK